MFKEELMNQEQRHLLNGFRLRAERLEGGGIALYHGCEINDADQGQVKKCKWISGIERENNEWRLFFVTKDRQNKDEDDDPVIIPDDFARFVKIALWAESRRYKSITDDFEFEPTNIKTGVRCFNINCNRFIAGVFGAVSFNERDDGGWGFGNIKPLFNIDEYITMKSEEEFRKYIVEILGKGGFGVGQIIRKEDNNVQHSFMVIVSKLGGDILCVDKENGGHAPFRVLPDDILFSTIDYIKDELMFVVKPVDDVRNILEKDPRIKK